MNIKLLIYRGITWLNNFIFSISIPMSVLVIIAIILDYQTVLGGESPVFIFLIYLLVAGFTGLFRYLSNEVARIDEYKYAIISLLNDAYIKTLIILVAMLFAIEQFTNPTIYYIKSFIGSTIISLVLINYVFLLFAVYSNFFSNVIKFIHSDYSSFEELISKNEPT